MSTAQCPRVDKDRQQDPAIQHAGGAIARLFLMLLAYLRQIGCDLAPETALQA